jgi:hypothetical protein
MIALILNLFLLAVLIWVGVGFTKAYRAATGTRGERALAAAKGSWTILWAQLVIISTGLINVIAMVGGVVDPGAVEQIRSMLSPQYGAALLVGVMLITVVARLRSLGKD